MSDDVSYAASIGASINRGLGSINPPKKKKPADNEDKTTNKTKETPQPEATKPQKETPAVKKPSSKKTKTSSKPIMVKSERINKPTEPTGPKPIMYNYKDLPTSGPGSEFNPNRGRQFKGTKSVSGNEIDEITGPVNPKGNPTGKFINPTGPIF
jgi:hypothetical protein